MKNARLIPLGQLRSVAWHYLNSILIGLLLTGFSSLRTYADGTQTITDSDGDIVTISLKGSGTLNVTIIDPDVDLQGPIDTIELTGTDANSSLALKVKKVGDGHISVGSIFSDGPLKSIAGKAADLIGGDGIDIDGFVGTLTLAKAQDSLITLTGAGVPSGGLVLGKLTIAGPVSNSAFLIEGSLGAWKIGSMQDSEIYAGFTPDDANDPLAGGTFSNGVTIGSITIKGVKGGTGSALANSIIAAANVGKISVGSVNTNNAGNEFGVIGNTIGSVSSKAPPFKFDPDGASQQGLGDFQVVQLAGGGGPTNNPPSAPTGVTATGGVLQVTVGWNNVSGATSYNVYRASESGVNKSNHASLTNGAQFVSVTSPYVDSGQTAGTTNFYVVTAVNANGESVESSQVSAIVQEPPNLAPTAVDDATATITNTTVNISVLSNDSDPEGDPLDVINFTQPANGTASFTNGVASYTPNTGFSGTNSFTYTISDGQGGQDVATVTVNVVSSLLDPSIVASALSNGVATILSESIGFLYSGPNAIQFGVDPDTIDPVRVAVIRGKVKNRDETPLSDVRITIHDHPEFGVTFSRADGMFDMAVNGGGLMRVNYEKTGFCPVQRQLNVPWQDYVTVAEVVMIPRDTVMTTVAFGSNSVMQVHQGSMQTDADGARTPALLFPPGTSASILHANGTTQSVSSLSIRATEYTVGTNGPAAMPAILPPNSGYTYAAELSADEAVVKIGGKDVLFNQPVFFYQENFLNFPVGMIVPVGYYDGQKAAWVPAPNGRVIKILSITAGFADVDTNGDANADTGEGITDGEREQLATLYVAGQTLWRIPLTHLSTWDYNWPYGPPNDAISPDADANINDNPLADPAECPGCVIEAENQVLGDSVAVVGTPFSLNYRSDRVPGRVAARTLDVRLSGASVPASLTGIRLRFEIAGQLHDTNFAAVANQQTSFVWDGLDAYGRAAQGGQRLVGSVDYVYPAVYKTPAQFAQSFANFGGSQILGSPARGTVTISKPFVLSTGGNLDARQTGVGGWTLNVHHVYDPIGRILHTGDGRRRTATAKVVETVAAFGGAQRIAIAADGSVYVTIGNIRVNRIAPDGTITMVAGGGSSFDDGIPATQAGLIAFGIAIAPDGNLYICDRSSGHRLRKVSPDGIITTVAGKLNEVGLEGNEGPATEAQLNEPRDVAVAPDGSIIIVGVVATVGDIRRITPDGIIHLLVNRDNIRFGNSIAIAPDGTLYIGGTNAGEPIPRITPDGIQTYITNPFDQVGGLAIDPNGFLHASGIFGSRRIWLIRSDKSALSIFGTGDFNSRGDGGPPTVASGQPFGLAFAPNGTLYFADANTGGLRRIGPALPGYVAAAFAIASEDGSELYAFDASGRHLQTLNALTGATLIEFGYDADGHLTTVTEKTGGTDNVTTIQYDGAGNPTTIVGPFGQTTILDVDANGFIADIVNPATESVQFAYSTQGLLLSKTDPRGKTTTFEYDAEGRLMKDTYPGTGFQEFSRNVSSNSVTVTRTTALGRETTFETETLPGNVQNRTVTAPDGTQVVSVKSFDAGTEQIASSDGTTSGVTLGPDPRFGMESPVTTSVSVQFPSALQFNAGASVAARLTNSLNPLSLTSLTNIVTQAGLSTTNVYTAATRTFVAKSPAGRTGTHTIDDLGRIVQGQFGGLAPCEVAYDIRGRLASVTLGSGGNTRSVNYTYNAEGFVDTITDSSGRTAQLAYDAAGRVITKTLPDGREVGLGHDAVGHLTSLTPPGRPAHTFTYSDRDEWTGVIPPAVAGTGPTSYAYDADKAMTNRTRAGAETVTFDRDTSGRVVTRTLATNGVTTAIDSFSYDNAGRLTNVTAASGVSLAVTHDGLLPVAETWSGPVTGIVALAYNNALQIASESVNGTNAVDFTYDSDGLLTGAGSLVLTRDSQHGLPVGSALGVVASVLQHNEFAELTNYTASASGSPLYSSSLTRDALGRVSAKTETVGGVTDTYGYAYDLSGQLTNVTKNSVTVEQYFYDDNGNRTNATVNGVVASATYDDQDRLIQYGATSYAYTAAGDLQSKTNVGQTTVYQYDALGNLLKVELPSGTNITYVIDGRNRRFGKRVDGTFVQSFLFGDSLRPVAELDGSGTVVSRFVYARGHVPAYLIKGGVSFRLVTDPACSVRLVVNTVTGAVVQRLDYDTFGNVIADTNPGFQPFGFTGGLYDPDTGLTRFGTRDYDSETGRWTVKDPIGFSGNDPNLYRYCYNNPVNLADPTGMDFFDLAAGAAETINEGIYTLNPLGAIQLLTDDLVRAAARGLGVDPGPSLRDQLFRWNPAVDRESADYALGEFVGDCTLLATTLPVGAGIRAERAAAELAELAARNRSRLAEATGKAVDFAKSQDAADLRRIAEAADLAARRAAQAAADRIQAAKDRLGNMASEGWRGGGGGSGIGFGGGH